MVRWFFVLLSLSVGVGLMVRAFCLLVMALMCMVIDLDGACLYHLLGFAFVEQDFPSRIFVVDGKGLRLAGE